MQPRWCRAASRQEEVPRQWEESWVAIADDFWEVVAVIRAEHPFPEPPGVSLFHQVPSTDDGLTKEWMNKWRQNMEHAGATQHNDDHQPQGLQPAHPGALKHKFKGRRALAPYHRVWTLLADQRRPPTVIDSLTGAVGSVTSADFVGQKLRRELLTMLESTMGVLYDLGYGGGLNVEDHDDSRHDGLMRRQSSSTVLCLTTPVKTRIRALAASPGLADDMDDPVTLARLMNVPERERESALGWVLQVLLTLRLHTCLLSRHLRFQFKALEWPSALGPKAIDNIIAEVVKQCMSAHWFYEQLAKAVASLELPSRMGIRSPQDNVVLDAIVPVVNWCFSSGLVEMVSTLANELKLRWAHAAATMVENMSPELPASMTALQLLTVIDHCNAMIVKLASAIGAIHARSVSHEVKHAVLSKDTVGLIMRSIVRAALSRKAGEDVAQAVRSLDDAANVDDGTGSTLSSGPRSFAAETVPSILCTSEGDAEAGGELPSAIAVLRRITHEGVGIEDVEDELTAALAEYLSDQVSCDIDIADAASGHPAAALHLVDGVEAIRAVLDLPLSLPLLPASAKTAAARSRAATASVRHTAGADVMPSSGEQKRVEFCVTALSRAAQQVVGSRSAMLEEAFARVVFDSFTASADCRDDVVALCDYLQSADRFVELCKHCVAAHFLLQYHTSRRVPPVSQQQPRTASSPQSDGASLRLTATQLSLLAKRFDPAVTTTAVTLHNAWKRFEDGLHDEDNAPPWAPEPTSPALPLASATTTRMNNGSIFNHHQSHALPPPTQSSLPTGSVAESGDLAGAIVPMLDAHAALRRRLHPAVLSPLTSLLLELRNAYFVDSDTVASPLVRSSNDLSEATTPAVTMTAVVPRPVIELRCRCLSFALWEGHVPMCERTHVQSTTDAKVESSLLSLDALEVFDKRHASVEPLRAAMRWLRSQYTGAFPQRSLRWPAMCGDVVLRMRCTRNYAPKMKLNQPTTYSVTLHCLPLIAVVLLQFNANSRWSVEDLAKQLAPLTAAVVTRVVQYLIDVRVLEATADSLITVVSSIDVSNSGLMSAGVAPHPGRLQLTGANLYLHDSTWGATVPDEPGAGDGAVKARNGGMDPASPIAHSNLASSLAATRQRAAEAAIVRVVKRTANAVPVKEVFESAASMLRSHFVLDARLFHRSVQLLVERDFLRPTSTTGAVVPWNRSTLAENVLISYVV